MRCCGRIGRKGVSIDPAPTQLKLQKMFAAQAAKPTRNVPVECRIDVPLVAINPFKHVFTRSLSIGVGALNAMLWMSLSCW
jgi:hypothetical protein